MIIASLSVLTLVAILWLLGWYAKRWVLSDSDYLLAGRQVSMIPGIAGICGIAFAGSMAGIIPAVTIEYGFMGWVLGATLPLVIGYIVYGLLAGPFARRSGAYTLPEWLEVRFDTRTRVMASIATLLGVGGLVAMNIAAMAVIMTGFLDAPLWVMVTVILFAHLIFILLGGLWAVVLTDVLQVLLGFVLLPALVGYCVWTYGGWDFIRDNFVTASPVSRGIKGSFPWFSVAYPSVLTIALLLGIFIQWGGNYYWLRSAASRSERVARWQFIIGGLLVLLVHGSFGVLGLYAGSVYREEFLAGAEPASAYGVLMRGLPPGVALFGLVAALSATISTASNAHMGITSVLVRDTYQRFLRPHATHDEVLRASRLLTLLTGIGIWLLCFYPGGPYFILAVSCAMLGPPAFIFLLGHRWRRVTATGAFWGGSIGIAAMLVAEVLKLAGLAVWSVHTVVIGTVVTLPAILLLSVMTTRSASLREPQPATALNALQRRVLELINHGYRTMAEVIDFLGMDSARVDAVVQQLEQAGLLRRGATSGLAYFSFHLTPAASNHVTVAADDGAPKLDSVSRQVLEQVAGGPRSIQELDRAVGATASALGAVVGRLVQSGYLSDGGMWQRRVTLSDQGRAVLDADRNSDAIARPD